MKSEFSVNNDNKKFPHMYSLPKRYKTPSKSRFIFAATVAIAMFLLMREWKVLNVALFFKNLIRKKDTSRIILCFGRQIHNP